MYLIHAALLHTCLTVSLSHWFLNCYLIICTGEWSTPNVSGQPPYPVDDCTLTVIGERRAALFGGRSGSRDVIDDLLIVELGRHTVVSDPHVL